jgi:hypothetical protein
MPARRSRLPEKKTRREMMADPAHVWAVVTVARPLFESILKNRVHSAPLPISARLRRCCQQALGDAQIHKRLILRDRTSGELAVAGFLGARAGRVYFSEAWRAPLAYRLHLEAQDHLHVVSVLSPNLPPRASYMATFLRGRETRIRAARKGHRRSVKSLTVKRQVG